MTDAKIYQYLSQTEPNQRIQISPLIETGNKEGG